jgi:hypothetical protein
MLACVAVFYRTSLGKAIAYLTTDKDWKWNLFWGGMWLLPPFVIIGWVLAMGARYPVGVAYFRGRPANNRSLKPTDFSSLVSVFVYGLKVILVIQVHLLPSVIIFWLLTIWKDGLHPAHLESIGFLISGMLLCLPVGIPAWTIVTAYSEWYHFGSPTVIAALTFALGVFHIPAAFVNVGWHGDMRVAFDFRQTLPFIRQMLPQYMKTWCICILVANVPGIVLVPLAPWCVFASYPIIVILFADVMIEWRRGRGEKVL